MERTRFSVEIDRSPVSVAHCLRRLEEAIPDFDYDWEVTVNSGGIDYGVYFNIDINKKEIEINNQPVGDGDDYLDDVIACFEDENDEDDEED